MTDSPFVRCNAAMSIDPDWHFIECDLEDGHDGFHRVESDGRWVQWAEWEEDE